MALKLRMLYRGPLSSCNYECSYCPFAKRHESAAELKHDRLCLERFVEWVAEENDCELSILFTPWGEGLTRRWYQDAIIRLSHLDHVRRVAIQTNLACLLGWLSDVNSERAALWCTYHPTQISRPEFLRQCDELLKRRISFSVGVVGLHAAFAEIEALRAELPPSVYLWINAYKDVPDYYSDEQIARLESIDPLFRLNLNNHPSLEEQCAAGETAVSIDGAGNLRRCHFVSTIIGNLYTPGWKSALTTRTCPNRTCDCYIGYANLHRLEHERLFGDKLLERIPSQSLWDNPATRKFSLATVEGILKNSQTTRS